MHLAGCQPLRGRTRRWLSATNSNAGVNVSASGAGSASAGVPAWAKTTHRTRGYDVGDVDGGAQGSRGAHW